MFTYLNGTRQKDVIIIYIINKVTRWHTASLWSSVPMFSYTLKNILTHFNQINLLVAPFCGMLPCTQCNAMQCNAMQCNAMQCNAMQCNAMQCNAMQCNAMQCNAMQCNAMQCIYNQIVQHSKMCTMREILKISLVFFITHRVQSVIFMGLVAVQRSVSVVHVTGGCHGFVCVNTMHYVCTGRC